jgi:hypothetical protein
VDGVKERDESVSGKVFGGVHTEVYPALADSSSSARLSGDSRGMLARLMAGLCVLFTLGGIVSFVSDQPASAASIEGPSVVDVGSNSATFQAVIDPQGSTTTYKFEYGAGASYEASVPVPEGNAGEGSNPVAVEAHVQGLLPDTIYHFRVVAKSTGLTTERSSETFVTQTEGGEFELPDGRAWELVSPVTKGGAGIEAIPAVGVVQASNVGNAITYVANGATEIEPMGNQSLSQIISIHGNTGWVSQDIATPHEAVAGRVGAALEYKFFSPDLSFGMVEPRGATPLPPLSQGAEKTIYRRNDVDGSYLPLVTAENVPLGTGFGGDETEPGLFTTGIVFKGATSDLTHVILESKAPLTEGAGEHQLYEWSGGELRHVSLLPEETGGISATAPVLGNEGFDVRNAVSSDGSRVIWTDNQEHLYVRDLKKEKTLRLDEAQEGEPEENGTAQFQIASSDGSKVFFTDKDRLTTTFTGDAGTPTLYECSIVEIAGKLTCMLRDLTTSVKSLNEGAGLLGAVLGLSEDASYIYMVAEGVLSNNKNSRGEEAVEGGANLYVLHYSESGKTWESTFIAGLSKLGDSRDWGDHSPTDLPRMTSRVSPNGHYLAFMSEQELTGYDNRDASNWNLKDEEVFLYDAISKKLVCTSCNPTGARPLGVEDSNEANGGTGLLVDRLEMWGGHRLAGSIPGWTGVDLFHGLYQPRYLSDSGRLFFDSSDALVPQDTNGKEDVYEYEPEGIPAESEYACTQKSLTYSKASDGCISLISSGLSDEESAFMDASETGDDVFFLTSAKLVFQDREDAFAIYDAHVCSYTAPCESQPTALLPCVTADSCRAAPTVQPGIFGAPASATFTGMGNVMPVVLKSTPKKKIKKKKVGRRKRRHRLGGKRARVNNGVPAGRGR